MALRHIILAVSLGVVILPPGHAQERRMTLQEALDRAERVDPQVIQALGAYRNTSAAVRTAYGQFLPDLRATATWGTSFSDGPSRLDPTTNEILPGGTTNSSLSLGASATYDLFTGFRRGRDLTAARASRAQADAAVDYQRAQNRLRTTRAFIEAAQTAQLVAVRREAIRRAEEQFQIAIARLATRAANVADSLTATVTLNEARLRLASEERQLAASEAGLGRLIGEDGRVSAVIDSSLFGAANVTDTNALRAEALRQAPHVLRTEAAEDAAAANLSAAKSLYLPSLNLTANTSFAGSRLNEYQLYNNRSMNLGLSYPLFNRFQREQQIATRRSDYESAAAQAADARREVGATLTTQLAALRAAEIRVTTALANLDAARALVRVQLERYRIGSLTIDVLSRAQEQLDAAEAEAVRARFEYILAKAEIEALIGRTL